MLETTTIRKNQQSVVITTNSLHIGAYPVVKPGKGSKLDRYLPDTFDCISIALRPRKRLDHLDRDERSYLEQYLQGDRRIEFRIDHYGVS